MKTKQCIESKFDFETYPPQVVQGLIQDQDLTGEESLPKPLIANFIEGALSTELVDHSEESKAQGIEKTTSNKPTATTKKKQSKPQPRKTTLSHDSENNLKQPQALTKKNHPQPRFRKQHQTIKPPPRTTTKT